MTPCLYHLLHSYLLLPYKYQGLLFSLIIVSAAHAVLILHPNPCSAIPSCLALIRCSPDFFYPAGALCQIKALRLLRV